MRVKIPQEQVIANGGPASATPEKDLIAICGIAMRLPSGVNDEEAFWDVLYNGKDLRAPIPADRYNAAAFTDAMGKRSAIKPQHGYFLDADLSATDPSFFTMTRSEMEKADPNQRQLLEVARECFESAGEVNYRGKNIGCFVGTFGEDWLMMQSKENQYAGVYSGIGDIMIANRVGFEYDLRGPSMVIKTGCSASLVGLHTACRAIKAGDCESALVAGTSLIMGPYLTMTMDSVGILSPDASCKTFDASANGFARADAINAIFIKRLDNAIRDGNPIRAVIRGTSTNHNGRAASLMAPRGVAHEALMRSVYREAGLDPSDTAFVECHGTGTAVGDAIETVAIGNVFGDKGVFIGSAKPNVGHAEGASGINGVIKAVLALEHRTIPPQIKLHTPNPKIPFREKNLWVPLQPTPWPRDRKERVSVNSFGVGGTNAHAVIDSLFEVRPDLVRSAKGILPSAGPHLMVTSANTPESLKNQILNLQNYLKGTSSNRSDIAYTLAQRREHLPFRGYVIIGNDSTAEISSTVKKPANVAPVTMIFTGQGAHWPQMGKDLMDSDLAFRNDIRAMDAILQGLKYPPSWSVEDELRRAAETSNLSKAVYSQPLCTIVQVALVNALFRAGVRPAAVAGHSSGEIAAAYAAGSLSVQAAVILAYYRGYVTQQQTEIGGMAAVSLGRDAAARYLTQGVVIACENSPSNVSLSGDIEPLQKVMQIIKDEHPDALVRLLKVDMAYHSHHMATLARTYVDLVREEIIARGIVLNNPQIALYSSVFPEVISDAAQLGPEYWGANLSSPVCFHTAIARLLQDQPENVFIEVGPHSALSGPLRQICDAARASYTYIPAMLRSKHSGESLLSAYGQLYQQGVPFKFESVVPTGRVVHDLPSYAWDHTDSFWNESRISKEYRFRRFGHHALLGQYISENSGIDPSWRVILDLADESWLGDHKVRDDIVYPFAGYVAVAGEAIRQLTGIETGYSIRHAVAHTALVLAESKPVEMITTLRRQKYTDATESDAYEFTISSWSGSSWIKHCTGLVRAAAETSVAAAPTSDFLPRQSSPGKFYEIMKRVGLCYGPEFRGLTALAASATDQLAAGIVTNTASHQDAPYIFHPAALDSCFQIVLAATAQLAGRNVTQLSVPNLIEELDVYRSASEMSVRGWSHQDGRDVGLDCVADGNIAVRLRGFRLTALDDGTPVKYADDRHAAARIAWYPDSNFADLGALVQFPRASYESKLLTEELAILCLLDSHEALQSLTTQQPHFLKFREWLAREKANIESGSFRLIENAVDFLQFSNEERNQQIQKRVDALRALNCLRGYATGVVRTRDHIRGLFTGEVDTLDLLLRDNVLADTYSWLTFDFGELVRTLSKTKPTLRILEVGAGTGGSTEAILRALLRDGGNPAYSQYTFTDISAGFFAQTQELFAYAPNMEYRVFDIASDPFAQGFEASSYDVILASNVVHATVSLNQTLSNLRPLLKPDGHIVLAELCAEARGPGYMFGGFSGWWLGQADDREWQPYVTPDRWDQELKNAGFTGADTVVYDSQDSIKYCAAIISQPKRDKPLAPPKTAITVLCNQPSEGIGKMLIKSLRRNGFIVSVVSLGGIVPADQDVISTLDLESPLLENISEADFAGLQTLWRDYKQQKMLWLLPPTQVGCENPRSGQTVGMLRGMRAELAIPLHSLEINPAEKDFASLVQKVFQKVQSLEDVENIAPDREWAVQDGVIKISRYQPFHLEQEMTESNTDDSHISSTLEIGQPGLLSTLQWVQKSLPEKLAEFDVEIETRAVGLNFRDIMSAMGILKFGGKSPILGIEATGVVTRIGSKVETVAVGDRVCGLVNGKCLSTRVVMSESLVVQIPESLSFVDGASMLACYSTVVAALLDVGQLSKDQSILIHSACGGVGHAAIDLSRMIGAEIYCTVSSLQKRTYLIEKMGIPNDHIFNSRDDSFLKDLMAATNGRGVDLVLNSLSGPLLHASWKCVAELGKLVELGKRDLVEFGKLDMEPFLANRSYCCFDLMHAVAGRPKFSKNLMKRWVDLYSEGHIRPIQSIATYEWAEVEQAFRRLQKGDNIGKVVIVMPTAASQIPSAPQKKSLVLDSEASYLLTGGLGGVGKSIATWMVEHGARNLIFLSRSAGVGEDNQRFFAELNSLGCQVQAVAGKVDDKNAVQECLRKATKPIKGIFHLAMVLRDAQLLDLSYDDWTSVVAPKVDGAWTLHNAFLEQPPLDFFVMSSSIITLADQPGQTNYAAANTFLEAFCQYRNRLGHAASVLSLPAIDDIGYVVENPTIRRKLQSNGLYFLPERELLESIEMAVLNSHPRTFSKRTGDGWWPETHAVIGLRSELHLEDPNCGTCWRRDRRMGTYHNITRDAGENSGTASANTLKAFLIEAAIEPKLLDDEGSKEFLAKEIGMRIFRFMMKPEEDMEISMTLSQTGMDSLMAIEMRRWWKQAFGLDTSVLEILGAGTVEGLGKIAAAALKAKLKN